MQSKRIVTIFMIVGGYIGGYIPALWGAGGFTFSSLIFNALGAISGVWIGFKISQ